MKTTRINEFKIGDGILVSSTHGLGKKIQFFQLKKDKASGKYNHSAEIWWMNGTIVVQEQTQAPDQKIRANANLTLFKKYLEGDSELLHLVFKYDVEEMGMFNQYQKILIQENGRVYDFLNLFKYSIVRTLFGWWTGGKKNRDIKTVCHEEKMYTTRLFGKLLGKDWFPEYYKADVSMLFHSDLFEHRTIDKKAVLESLLKKENENNKDK